MKINWENMSHSEQMDTQAMLYPFWKKKAEELLQKIVEMEKDIDNLIYREKFLERYVDELKQNVKELEKKLKEEKEKI